MALTPEQAKEKGYTHHATLYGVDGFAELESDDEGFRFEAKTWIGNKIVDWRIAFEVFFDILEGFPIWIGEKL